VLLVFGQTDKMFLGSYVCTEKNLRLEDAVENEGIVDDTQKLERNRQV
jgi:hypothetical protein